MRASKRIKVIKIYHFLFLFPEIKDVNNLETGVSSEKKNKSKNKKKQSLAFSFLLKL